MEAKKLTNISISDYIKIEEESDAKYEFHDGSIFAMAGGTINHGLIIGNAFSAVKAALKSNKNCTSLTSEIKLHIEQLNKFVYPDGMVVCGDIERAKKDSNSITNPAVIIEVLSHSTESYDRGDKFYFYRQIPSLKEYILIDQYQAKIEVYNRHGDMWQIRRLEGIDKMLEITSINIEIALEDVYEGVSFEAL